MRHQVRGAMTMMCCRQGLKSVSHVALLPDPVMEAPTALNEPGEIFRKDMRFN